MIPPVKKISQNFATLPKHSLIKRRLFFGRKGKVLNAFFVLLKSLGLCARVGDGLQRLFLCSPKEFFSRLGGTRSLWMRTEAGFSGPAAADGNSGQTGQKGDR